MQDILYPIGKILVWTFDTFIETAQNLPNLLILILMFVGLFFWMGLQSKYNKQASQNADQLK